MKKTAEEYFLEHKQNKYLKFNKNEPDKLSMITEILQDFASQNDLPSDADIENEAEKHYKQVFIRTEADLPKENRPYIVGYKRMDYDNGERDGWLGYFVKDNYYKKLWLRDVDWYLQELPESNDKEIIEKQDELISLQGMFISYFKKYAGEAERITRFSESITKCESELIKLKGEL